MHFEKPPKKFRYDEPRVAGPGEVVVRAADLEAVTRGEFTPEQHDRFCAALGVPTGRLAAAEHAPDSGHGCPHPTHENCVDTAPDTEQAWEPRDTGTCNGCGRSMVSRSWGVCDDCFDDAPAAETADYRVGIPQMWPGFLIEAAEERAAKQGRDEALALVVKALRGERDAWRATIHAKQLDSGTPESLIEVALEDLAETVERIGNLTWWHRLPPEGDDR